MTTRPAASLTTTLPTSSNAPASLGDAVAADYGFETPATRQAAPLAQLQNHLVAVANGEGAPSLELEP